MLRIATVLVPAFLLLSPMLPADDFLIQDSPTGISSSSNHCLSFRYQRHIWQVDSNAFAAVIQQGGHNGRFLELWEGPDSNWEWGHCLSIIADEYYVSDGLIDSEGYLHLVVSVILPHLEADVIYFKLQRLNHINWKIEKIATLKSSADRRYSMASIAVDSNNIAWIAARCQDSTGAFFLEIFYLEDPITGALIKVAEFGKKDSCFQKNPILFSYGTKVKKIGCVWHEGNGNGQDTTARYKHFAFRRDSFSLNSQWLINRSPIVLNHSQSLLDMYGTHWYVLPDDDGVLHIVYEDEYNNNQRMFYSTFEKGNWSTPILGTDFIGHYSALGLKGNKLYWINSRSDGTAHSLYYNSKFTSNTLWNFYDWIPFTTIISDNKIRMSCTERFVRNMLSVYQVTDMYGTHDIYYSILDTGK